MSVQVPVAVHCEEGRWWAESSHLPGFTAIADSVAALRSLVDDALALHIDGAFERVETFIDHGPHQAGLGPYVRLTQEV